MTQNTSKQPEHPQNMLNKLRDMMNKNPELVHTRIKSFYRLSDNSDTHVKKFIELINNGYTPVIYSNHQSHADGGILSILTHEAITHSIPSGQLRGFLCPIAASIESGDQNDTVQGVVSMFAKIVAKSGFVYVSVIRKDDREKYGIEGSNLEALEKLMRAPKDGYGLAIFPEGSVQGGRKKPDGSIYGMQQVEEGGKLLLRCVNFWKEQGRESVLLPIGIINSYQIFSPDSYHISEDLLEMIDSTKEIKKIANVAVGKPFTTKDVQKDLGSFLNPKNQNHIDYLMNKIADLLPSDAKGYYGNNSYEGL